MLEPIDFTSTNTYSFESLGKVESKIISAKDEYILHIDLYESYGSCVLGEFYIGPATIGSIDDFTITTNDYITTIEVGGGDSGNIVYPGLIAAWSAKGKTNDDEDRDILRDLTGNGHDITLNGFAFSEMSGYGGYVLYENNFYSDIPETCSFNKNIVTLNKPLYNASLFFNPDMYIDANTERVVINRPAFKIKVSGLVGNEFLKVFAGLYDGVSWTDVNKLPNIYNGITDIPAINHTYNQAGTEGNKLIYQDFIVQLSTVGSSSNTSESIITIEILPKYPDALVFDGVDDYGINENMPQVNDYTYIIKREILSSKRQMTSVYGTGSYSDSRTSYMWFEYETDNGNVNTYSFNGVINVSKHIPKLISYQTKTNYNGNTITIKELIEYGTAFHLGGLYGYQCNMAFYSAYLFDRSLDEQEIKAFIRKYIDPEYLLPSEIPTPDCYYDFSLGSNDDENRETIKDQSGNGNDAKAYNIAWAGMSGYGGYVQTWSNRIQENDFGKIIINSNSITFEPVSTSALNIGEDDSYLLQPTENNIKIKIIGLKSDGTSIFQINVGNSVGFNTNYDGVYSIKLEKGFRNVFVRGVENTVTIELLPEYEGALVLDGIDDYISLDAFDSGFKTIFMVCNPFIISKMLYDQRTDAQAPWTFAIYNHTGSTAYVSRSMASSKTYINGILNNKKVCDDLLNKKQLLCHIVHTLNNTNKPYIGTSFVSSGLNANMAIYKFLGFKEELTEEQIQAIIKKYNLLDGVDEIEVS